MVLRLIAQARRRLIKNALGVETARSAGACLAALILVLLLGTDTVTWPYATTLPIATLAMGTFLTWRGRFTDYQIAQLLDKRLDLCDTLSTAVFYYTPLAKWRCQEETRLMQRKSAEIAAAEIDVNGALPVRFPRALIVSIAWLALVAAGLTLLRFQMHDAPSFRHGLARMAEPLLKRAADEIAKLERQLQSPAAKPFEQSDDLGDENAERANSGTASNDPSVNLEPSNKASQENQSGKEDGSSKSQATPEPGDTAGNANETPHGSENLARDDPSSSDHRSRSSAGAQANSQQKDAQPSQQAASQTNASSSLWGRFSDTIAKLAALTAKAGGASNNPSGQNAPSAANHPNAARGASSDPGQQQPGNGGQQGTMNGQNSGSDPHRPDKEGSGAGSEDGNKAIQEGQELEAMGKISVIFGKRSQDISGTATVEAVSGRSDLSTPYVTKRAEHHSVEDSAAHDQIPLEFEAYMQRYFMELRKTQIPKRK